MILLGIFIAIAYWCLSALVDVFVLAEQSLFDSIFFPGTAPATSRLLALLILILISLYFRSISRRRKRIEDELDQEYNLSSLDLNRIGALAFVFDISGRIVYFNQACEKLTGYSCSEVRDKHFWKLFLEPNSAEAMKDRLASITEKPFLKEHEIVWLSKTGQRHFIKWFNRVVFDSQSKPKYIISVGAEITEYHQRQNIFRGFKRQYQGLIDNIGIGIAIISSDLTIAYKNRQFKEWFPKESISERSVCHDIISKFSSEVCRKCPTCKALNQGASSEAVIETETSGKNMVYKVAAVPVVDEKGKVVGAIETIQNFTKISRQEKEIRHGYLAQAVINSLLRFSLENITLEGFLKCALSIVVSTPWLASESKAAIYLVGDEPEVLTLRAQVNLSPQEVKAFSLIKFGQGLVGEVAQAARGQFSSRIYQSDELKTKSTKAYAHYCLPILYSGVVLGVIDIYLKKNHVQNKQEEEFLAAVANTLAGVIHRKEVEARLSKINTCFVNLGVDAVSNIQSFVSLSGEILEANTMFYQRFDPGTDSLELVAEYNSSDSRLPPTKIYEHLCHQTIKAKGKAIVCDVSSIFESEAANKFHTFLGQAVKFADGHTGLLCGFFKDYFKLGQDDREFLGIIVSAIGVEEERIKSKQNLDLAYVKLKEAQYELVQTEKLAALGRFSSGMAHEVKNPLGIILGGIEFLEKKLQAEDKDINIAVKKIKESTLRADGVVRNLLQFAMPSEIKTERIKPKDLINDTLALVKYRVALINIKISTNFTKEAVLISGDKNQLQQVIFNLIINAVEAMPKGGTVRIKTSKMDTSDLAKPACLIEVSDTGEGIAAKDLSKLFEPFFTTKRDKKGTGLGLSISKIIIENHKGHLTVNSQVKKGTTVRISLPLVD